MDGEPSPATLLSAEDFRQFCAPIGERIAKTFSAANPRVSIVLPAYNEQCELLPTLLGFTCLDVDPGVAELVVADNASTDATAVIIKTCGAKYVHCSAKGVGHCRRAAYGATSKSSEYIWLTDADARTVPPLKFESDLDRRSSILRTNCNHLDRHPNVLGLSTGGVPEGGHWIYRLNRSSCASRLGLSEAYSCWAGYNLESSYEGGPSTKSGGSTPMSSSVMTSTGHYEQARYRSRIRKNLDSAQLQSRQLADPVYYSGRRYASARLLLRHYLEAISRRRLPHVTSTDIRYMKREKPGGNCGSKSNFLCLGPMREFHPLGDHCDVSQHGN